MKNLTLSLLAAVAAIGFMTPALAADLIVDPPLPGVVTATGGWEGPYIGIFAGYAGGLADQINTPIGSPCLSGGLDGCDVGLLGGLLGVKAGANFYLGSSVVGGIVGDVAWSNVSGTDIFPFPVDDSTNTIHWQGSVRGILGVDAGAFLPYLTAGLAVANASHWSDYSNLNGIDTIHATHLGWTIGAGASVAVTEDVSLNLEYRYSDFGSKAYDHDTGLVPPEFALTQHAVTVGLNWSF